MNRHGYFFASLFLTVLSLISASSTAAQANTKIQADQDYDITLQVLIGTNDAGAYMDVPQNLGNITKQIKPNFVFSRYRLAYTLLGRSSTNGEFEYKSMFNAIGEPTQGDAQSFLEWSLRGLRSSTEGLQAQAFRFGARLPVNTSNTRDESGKTQSVFVYEGIGLNLSRVGIMENVPTLLGSLSLPKTNGTLFLVLTLTPIKQSTSAMNGT